MAKSQENGTTILLGLEGYGVHPYDWTERVSRVWRGTLLGC